jgi:hypothetical protein
VSGQPLLVTHEAGILTVTYEDLSWDGLMSWLRPQRHSANITVMVARDCPIQLGVVNATAIVSGLSARTSLKSVSGDITLDGVTGTVDANTVSGGIEARHLDGQLTFHSVSGDLTLAAGTVGRLDARTVSGAVTADVELAHAGDMRVSTLSGEVAIRLPAQTGAQVDLKSTSGLVRTDFSQLDAPDNPGVKKIMTGTLGDGSGRVSVGSMTGNVTILQAGRRDDGGATAAMGTGGQAKEGEAR